jgi:hypothetical protein
VLTCRRFRNDLRLHDNYVLHDAVQRVKRGEADEVMLLAAAQTKHQRSR